MKTHILYDYYFFKKLCSIKVLPTLYSQRLSRPGSNGCCRFFRLSGCVLEVFLLNISPVSVASIFRGQESELCLCSGAVCEIVKQIA